MADEGVRMTINDPDDARIANQQAQRLIAAICGSKSVYEGELARVLEELGAGQDISVTVRRTGNLVHALVEMVYASVALIAEDQEASVENVLLAIERALERTLEQNEGGES
jgi:hypothetical protein